MNKYKNLFLIILGNVTVLTLLSLVYFIKTFHIDLTHCQETSSNYFLENGFVEKEIGPLFANMYEKEFELDHSEIIKYTQLSSTTSDYSVGHVYFKSPEGVFYACGWYK